MSARDDLTQFMRTFGAAATVLRTYGLGGLRRRLVHEIRCACAAYRGAPSRVSTMSAPAGWRVYELKGDLAELPLEVRDRIRRRADRVVGGSYEAFGHDWRRLPSSAREWHTHPSTGHVFPACAWWNVALLPSSADVKDVWEPARFGWVYELVRAYAQTREPVYAQTFHRRLAEWCEANPPFQGVHWSCGQETAIRALAILFAMDTLPGPDDSADTEERRILDVLGWSGERIADAIGYGLSQRNNHGISESAGLIHLGLRLQGLHPQAPRWIERGCAYLEEQIRDQFAEDGWYAQHSFNYMRLALEQAILAQHVLTLCGRSLSDSSLSLLSAGARLLLRLVDGESGRVPNHGANDGGRATLISSADYSDFRPLLTEASLVLGLPLPADIPPDPETLALFGRPVPMIGPVRASGVATGASGWAVARLEGVILFMRAGSYRHRPSHLDALHIDLCAYGREVIVDAGTYAYNAEFPWRNALASAALHNGPVLDGGEPAERGPRFLWYSWPTARFTEIVHREGNARLVAEVPGVARREVDVSPQAVVVRDVALKSDALSMQVTWLLHPRARVAQVSSTASNVQVHEAREGDPTAWYSPTYGLRLASKTVTTCETRAGTELQIQTTIQLDA